jgi:hypothetical protein
VDAVEAITTNMDCRILAIGNPDDPSTEFANVCKPGSGWSVIQINGLETPNFTPEAVSAFPELSALFDRARSRTDNRGRARRHCAR